MINLTGPIASGGQADPCADGTRVPEVRRILHRRGEGGGRDGADAGHRGEQAAALIFARHRDQLLAQLRYPTPDIPQA